MTYSTSGTVATTMKNYNGGDGGLAGDIVLSFPIASSTSLVKGDLVKLTSGYLVKCSAITDRCIGYCDKTVDNSAGSAGDEVAPVCVRGPRKVDAVLLASTASFNGSINPFVKVGLAEYTAGGTAGQVVAPASVTGGSSPSVYVGKALSTQDVTASTDITRVILVYFDTIGVVDQA